MDTPKTYPTGSNGASGNWERTADQAASTAQDAMDKISDTARPAVDRLSATASQTMDKLSGAATQAKAVLSDKATQMKDMQDQVISDARVRVREKPVTALVIAVAVGFLLNQLWRSR